MLVDVVSQTNGSSLWKSDPETSRAQETALEVPVVDAILFDIAPELAGCLFASLFISHRECKVLV
jgi:hypothetical protein